jgi:hypothetical protein
MQLPEEIKKMNIDDKFLLIEKLWEEISKDIDNKSIVPQWHLDTIKKREENLEKGIESFDSFEKVKNRLYRFTNNLNA